MKFVKRPWSITSLQICHTIQGILKAWQIAEVIDSAWNYDSNSQDIFIPGAHEETIY